MHLGDDILPEGQGVSAQTILIRGCSEATAEPTRRIARCINQRNPRVNDLNSLPAQFHRAILGGRSTSPIGFGANMSVPRTPTTGASAKLALNSNLGSTRKSTLLNRTAPNAKGVAVTSF